MRTQREQILGSLASSATKLVTGKVVAKLGTQSLTRIGHPGLLVGDAVELGSRILCDSYGMEDRKAEQISTVAGAGTTMLTGATFGCVGGPAGMVIGAGAGLGFWFAGRVAGEIATCVFSRATRR